MTDEARVREICHEIAGVVNAGSLAAHREGKRFVIDEDKFYVTFARAIAALPAGAGMTEIKQHIGWLKNYFGVMSAANWRDMKDQGEKQLEQLSLELDRLSTTPQPVAAGEQEPGLRESVIELLWNKQFEGTPWSGKTHLIRPESLAKEYGPFADAIIAAVAQALKRCVG